MNVLQGWCFYLTTWFCNIRAVAFFVVSPFIYFIYLLYFVCLSVCVDINALLLKNALWSTN